MLSPSDESQDSPFAVMCRGAGKPTRDNLKTLIAQYQWLHTLTDPAPPLAAVSEAKVAQWANEAQPLRAKELREYVAPRRYALVLAALRASRGRLLDDLTLMLLKFTGKIVWRSQKSLADTRIDRGDQGDALITVLAEMLSIIGGDRPPADKVEALEATISAHGGQSVLSQSCKDYGEHASNKWPPFASDAFSPYRTQLLMLGFALPLKAARDSADNLLAAVRNVTVEPTTSDYYVMDLAREFLPPEWRALVGDRAGDPRSFNRRHLEVVTMLELAEAIKTGAINVSGSLSYDDFWGRLPLMQATRRRWWRTRPSVAGRWARPDSRPTYAKTSSTKLVSST